jgi:hypothetical protein
MQKTANQIKSEFELLASGHYQIHSFLYAQEFEQQAYENLIYPLMLVYPLGGNLSGTTYSRNYRVVIADRVLKSEGNELEVESDTQLIALDTLAYWMKLGTNERFSITSSNTITPFWEKWGDEVTGHFVDIGIEEFYDFNSCAIPLSGSIPSPTNPCKDARILINSVIYGNAPSDTNFNVVVKDQLGALVGSLIGGEWIVNTGGACADATYTIEDSLGNVLYTGTIPSGGSVTEVISNSTLNVNKSDGTLISSRSILAEGTDSYNVGDSSAVLKDEDGNVLSTTGIKATESKDIVAPNGDVSVNSVAFDDVLSGGTLNIEVLKSTGNDQIGSKQGQFFRIGDSTAVIKDSANNTLKSEAIMATETGNIVINDSVAVIKNSVGTTLKSENILAEATENITINDSSVENSDATYSVDVLAEGSLVLPDSQINVNGVDSGDVVSVKTIDVNLEDSLGAPVVPTSVGLVGNTLTIEVPTGGGVQGDYLVRFFDIDGTILKEEYVDAGNAATAPANPTYDSTYLTFDNWNNDFSNIQHDLDVGAIYDTSDGKTYLFLKVTTQTGLQPTLQLNKATTALLTIDWGDSTTNTTTTSGNVNVTKTAAYASVGDYVVSIECAANYGVSTGGYILGNNTTYSRTLIKAYIGANVNTFTDGFRSNTMLEICSFPNNLTSFGTNVFNSCASLRHFNMPSSITSYGTFNGCRSLKTISLSQGYNTIPNNCFFNCGSLQKVVFQDAATGIGISCFQDALSLESVYLPSICVTFSDSAFLRARSLKNISFSNNVAIGSDCFNACSSLSQITLPTGVSFTGGGHFRDCSSLQIVTINTTTLASIPNNIFQSNLALKRLEFPSTITSVGTASFFASAQILEYTFNSTTPPTLANINAFDAINTACKIYVPDANVAAYQGATNWSTYANYIYPLSTKP